MENETPPLQRGKFLQHLANFQQGFQALGGFFQRLRSQIIQQATLSIDLSIIIEKMNFVEKKASH